MTRVPYIWIPGMAVFIYLYLFIAFCSAEKNKILKAFMRYLIVLILWTGGSALMRAEFWPGYLFWYQISFLTLLTLPFTFYDFVYHYSGKGLKKFNAALKILLPVYLFLAYKQLFLKVPEKMVSSGDRIIFRYYADWKIVFPAVLSLMLIIISIAIVLKSVSGKGSRHRKEYLKSEAILILAGGFILVIGNVLSVLPGNIFPFDTLAGIINASLIFMALKKRRVFKLRLLWSPSVVMFGTVILSTAMMSCGVNSIFEFVKSIEGNSKTSLAITGIIFVLIVFLVSYIAYHAIRKNTLRKEQADNERFSRFSQDISRSLDVNKIMDKTCDILRESLGVSRVSIFRLDHDAGKYVMDYASNPLDKRNISIEADAPYIEYIAKGDVCLRLSDFKRSVAYRSMWTQEKEMLEELGVECITALRNNDELVGIILIGKKNNGAPYSYDDILFIESVQSVASIALNNAILYGEAQRRADMDPQLDMLNRTAFLRKMEEAITQCRGDQLSYMEISVDDLRLYNELYGMAHGDKVLQLVSTIIKKTVPRGVFCGRLAGKEFGICMPHRPQMEAVKLAENIREQLNRGDPEQDGIKRKKITFTAGICSMPYGATTMKELQTNVNMEIHHGKKLGKNRIMTYSDGMADLTEESWFRNSKINGAADPDHGVIKDEPGILPGQMGGRYSSLAEGKAQGTDAKPQPAKIIFSREYEEVAPTIYALTAAIDAKDHYTFNHSRNVAVYAMTLSRHLNLSAEHQELIYEAGLLHDIGKIAIPERILGKPGKLDDEEYETMKSHVNHSIEIIRHLPNLDYLIPSVVGHHERWDGKGYPNGLAGTDIPVGARCLAIADAFDAMTSKRSYKDALSVEYAAGEILRNAGTQFDPDMARKFVALINEGVIYLEMDDVIQ